jgi:2,3-dihydroxybenzoate-AMP ligase/acyl-CoA synthetase
MIIRGGQNIYPAEVESLLLRHPSVSNVAVVGIPDAEMGEKACAFVIPKPGKQFTFDEMVSFLRGEKIASYKFPERLEIISEFPLAGEAKIDKKELRKMITG